METRRGSTPGFHEFTHTRSVSVERRQTSPREWEQCTSAVLVCGNKLMNMEEMFKTASEEDDVFGSLAEKQDDSSSDCGVATVTENMEKMQGLGVPTELSQSRTELALLAVVNWLFDTPRTRCGSFFSLLQMDVFTGMRQWNRSFDGLARSILVNVAIRLDVGETKRTLANLSTVNHGLIERGNLCEQNITVTLERCDVPTERAVAEGLLHSLLNEERFDVLRKYRREARMGANRWAEGEDASDADDAVLMRLSDKATLRHILATGGIDFSFMEGEEVCCSLGYTVVRFPSWQLSDVPEKNEYVCGFKMDYFCGVPPHTSSNPLGVRLRETAIGRELLQVMDEVREAARYGDEQSAYMDTVKQSKQLSEQQAEQPVDKGTNESSGDGSDEGSDYETYESTESERWDCHHFLRCFQLVCGFIKQEARGTLVFERIMQGSIGDDCWALWVSAEGLGEGVWFKVTCSLGFIG